MQWLLILLVAVLPLGTRLFVGSAIPGLHEYEALFFYVSDAVVIVLLLSSWHSQRARLREVCSAHGGWLLVVMLIAGLAAAVTAPAFGLALYNIVRLALMVALAYSLGAVTHPEKLFRTVLAALAIIAVIEAGIGLAQFKQQGSVGLQILGEPVLVSYTGAASTVHADGGRFLRVYGTFPHPNIFAAFLALGALALAYWYLWCERQLAKLIFEHPRAWWRTPGHVLKALNSYVTHRYFYLRLVIAAAMFIVMLGLALSFSRSGWIAIVLGIIVLGVALVRYFPGAVLRMTLMTTACACAAVLLFKPIVLPRTQLSRFEPAVDERIIYNAIGGQVAENNPGGVGAGNQVLYSVEHHLYKQYGLTKVWKWEPVHNLYLLMTTEIGWLGLLSFLLFLGMVVWRLAHLATLEKSVVLAMLLALAIAGLFDHFLWTLQPGRLMLWVVIGLALSQLPLPKRS